MSNLNKVILIGRLTRDPELRYLASGVAICKFGLATSRKYRDKSDENNLKEEVCFVDISVWGKQGENCQEYLAKGRQVCVEGRLTYSSWETDEGQKRSKLEITAEKVMFLGSKDETFPKEGSGEKVNGESPADDVPF